RTVAVDRESPLFSIEVDEPAADRMTIAAQTFPGDLLVAIEGVGHGLRVRGLLVVIPAITSAGRGDMVGEVDAESPAAEIERVNAVVPEFAVAVVPEPVPV